LEVSVSSEEYIEKRLNERIEKLIDPVSRFEVEISMDKKKKLFRVEIMVHTPHRIYRAEDITESIEGSTDIAVDELERQIVRNKERVKDAKKNGGREFKEMLHNEDDL
jgi:ribosomal subunit interface protein